MDREKITERIYVESDSMNANVIVDGKIVKRFKNNATIFWHKANKYTLLFIIQALLPTFAGHFAPLKFIHGNRNHQIQRRKCAIGHVRLGQNRDEIPMDR